MRVLNTEQMREADRRTIQDIGIGPGFAGLQRAIEESRLRGFVGPCLMDEGDGLPGGLAGETPPPAIGP